LEILGYLQQHAGARDTLVGIARWWLLRQRIETMTKSVKKALDELIGLGLVLPGEGRVERQDRQRTYRVNPRRKQQIRTLLAGGQPNREAEAIGHKIKN
jgi:hypothetical protein